MAAGWSWENLPTPPGRYGPEFEERAPPRPPTPAGEPVGLTD